MKATQNNKHTIPCPECDTPLNISPEATVGKIIECHACGVESEIVTLDPLTLSPLEEEK